MDREGNKNGEKYVTWNEEFERVRKYNMDFKYHIKSIHYYYYCYYYYYYF